MIRQSATLPLIPTTSNLVSKSVPHSKVQPPINSVVDGDFIVELKPVARTEIELQNEGDAEFVFQTEDPVGTSLTHNIPDLHIGRGGIVVANLWSEAEPETHAAANKTVQAFHEVAFIQDIRSEFH